MKKFLTCIVLCSFLGVPAISFGAANWYGSVNTGVALMLDSDLDVEVVDEGSFSADLKYDAGVIFGGAVGYQMDKYRLEGALTYQKNNIDRLSADGESESLSGDISTVAFLINGYFDFPPEGTPLNLYISAGIGFAKVEADIEGSSDDDNLFIYQIGIGSGYALSESVTLDLRYSYMGGQDYKYSEAGEGSFEASVGSHNFIVGIRKAF